MKKRLKPPRNIPHEVRVIGVVLAGGLSSRLGRDKVNLPLPDGQTLLQRTAALLAACTDEVRVSCRASRDVSPYSAIHDLEDGLGPLGALRSILHAVEAPVLVLSCDLPFMDMATLRRLLAAHAAREAEHIMTTFQQAETGFIEALVAVYEPSCRPLFDQARANGLRQLNQVIPHSLQNRILYTQAEARPFFNINFPAELETARRMFLSDTP